MGENIEAIVKKHLGEVEKGENIDAIIEMLHAEGLTITDSIKVIMKLYGLRLGEAKPLVTDHHAWQEVVHSHQQFHSELEALMREQTS